MKYQLDFQLDIFLIICMGTFLIGVITFTVVKGFWRRFLYAGLVTGIYIYNGVGAACIGIPPVYLSYYFFFILSVSIAFVFFTAISSGLSRRSGNVLKKKLINLEQDSRWTVIIGLYLFLHFIPLLYPNFRIYDFFKPNPPDLTKTFNMIFEVQVVDPILKITEYVRILLTPFFFIALYRFNRNIKKAALVLMLLLYIQYTTKSYIGRTAVGAFLLIIFISIWVHRKDYRVRLYIVGIVLTPFLLATFYFYTIIRIGGKVHDYNVSNAIYNLVYQETSFPLHVGIPVIESNRRADLESYFRWILTLPIPKLLKGEIKVSQINYEISELILGKSMGSNGWFVVLPGLVAESIYIYGKYFFWIHGIFIGFIGAMMIRMVERTPQLLFLQAYIIVLFFYNLNRGGISGFLPTIVNHFLLFYGVLFFLILNPFRQVRQMPP